MITLHLQTSHLLYQSTISWLSNNISNGYLLTIDQVSTDHRLNVDQLLTDTSVKYRRTTGEMLAVSKNSKLYLGLRAVLPQQNRQATQAKRNRAKLYFRSTTFNILNVIFQRSTSHETLFNISWTAASTFVTQQIYIKLTREATLSRNILNTLWKIALDFALIQNLSDL